MADCVWIDGTMVASVECSLISGAGIFSGVRVMTTMLAIGQNVIDFERHMTRLFEHMEIMGINQNNLKDVLRFDIEKILFGKSGQDWQRLRLVLFRDQNKDVRRLFIVSPESPSGIKALQKSGLKLSPSRDSSWQKGAHIKTGLIGVRQIQLDIAKSSGFDDVLWMTGDGEVAEATWSNIFLIGRTGDLVEIATPPASTGILEGVTRKRVIDLLGSAKIPVTERVITEDEIPRFDEGFVTSSVRGLVPVTQIGLHRLHTLRPNAVFGHISRLYRTWLSTQVPSDFNELPVN